MSLQILTKRSLFFLKTVFFLLQFLVNFLCWFLPSAFKDWDYLELGLVSSSFPVVHSCHQFCCLHGLRYRCYVHNPRCIFWSRLLLWAPDPFIHLCYLNYWTQLGVSGIRLTVFPPQIASVPLPLITCLRKHMVLILLPWQIKVCIFIHSEFCRDAQFSLSSLQLI